MAEIDSTEPRGTDETFSEAHTTRAARKRAARLLQEVSDHRAVAVYGPESGRLVARARSPSFEEQGVATAVLASSATGEPAATDDGGGEESRDRNGEKSRDGATRIRRCSGRTSTRRTRG